ncbi:hypothetical protein [Larkinella rosea]|uniref:Uncharacterized protein n=1 Tax=Larkinella rosea TaxID=2025312 RepID=A0A3P1BRR1_9BACT|nr:hypothetical protein [Larkinella rosea]RRB03738.1 hypothetical protein EHT25_09370 [Larkinella rosea]
MFPPKVRAIWLFYRSFWLFSNALTLGLLWAFWPKLTTYLHLYIVSSLWFKLLSNAGIWYVTRKIYKAQFWFYYNLGLAEKVLFGGAFTIDLLIGFLLTLVTYQLLLIL